MLGCKNGRRSLFKVPGGRGDSILTGEAEDSGAEDVDGVWSDGGVTNYVHRVHNVLCGRSM